MRAVVILFLVGCVACRDHPNADGIVPGASAAIAQDGPGPSPLSPGAPVVARAPAHTAFVGSAPPVASAPSPITVVACPLLPAAATVTVVVPSTPTAPPLPLAVVAARRAVPDSDDSVGADTADEAFVPPSAVIPAHLPDSDTPTVPAPR